MTASVKLHRPRVNLSAKQRHFLLRLFSSAVLEKAEADLQSTWTFADACRFWNLDTRQEWGERLEWRLARFTADLGDCFDAIGAAGRGRLVDRRGVTHADLRRFRELHRELLERFEKHLSLLRLRRVKGEV